MPAILVQDLRKKYAAVNALDGVNFTVPKGTFFGCFGPNGAGKSTLLKVLTGQIPQTSGSAQVLGMEVRDHGVRVRDMVGIVPEVESPPSYLTAYEFLYFVAQVRRIDDVEKRIDRWLKFFDLEETKGTLCKDLSKGMRQKVMLSAAFIHEPQLLFLDEPFVNLDPIYQHKLREYLLELRGQGRTIFLCSHILEIAQKLCQEMVILNHGKVVASGRVEDLTVNEDLESLFLRMVSEDAST
ncbi:MAG: putative branched-chain amino acid transport ATP-binding protein LivG [Methanomassiliicoccales archaeon PtaU1.Bin030]|nr:MAG: putative branched-chain amino acid transport ATP-binding protein LivG [Methanomassiliicoccales archaeon PtaU1.Bin030]